MTFLSPLFLLAVPLVAAPVIIHLLRKKQRTVVPWGAMHFLTDAVSRGRRFDRIEEWLLMALRVAALAALILAMARPLIVGFGGDQSVGREVVLVIDDSLSTDLQSPGGKAIDDVIEKAKERLAECTPGDQVRVMLAAAGPRWLQLEPVRANAAGKRTLEAQLDEVRPTEGAANWHNCLRLAASFRSEAQDTLRRQVVVLHDGQRHGWQPEALGVWGRLGTAIQESPHGVSVQLVQCGDNSNTASNLALGAITSTRSIIAEGEPLTLRVAVTNTGDDRSKPTLLQWSVDGEKAEQIGVPAISAGQTYTVEHQAAQQKEGVHEFQATLDLDSLTLDNHSLFVVDVVKALPILLLTGERAENSAENLFFTQALGHNETVDAGSPDSEARGSWRSVFKPTLLPVSELSRTDLNDFHAVVVNDIPGLSQRDADQLESYVRDGGGLWLLLGPRVEREDFNRRWHRDGAGLCPLPLAKFKRPREPGDSDATIHPPSDQHAATATLADTRRLDINKVRLTKYYTFRQPTGRRYTPLLESGRGAPLSMLQYFGKGRVIVQALPFRTDWSDLPASKSFVVLVQDWLSYLTQPAITRYNLSAREPFQCDAWGEGQAQQAEVTLPNGEKEKLDATVRGGTSVFRYTKTALPGRYELARLAGDKTQKLPFAVEREPLESDARPLSPTELTFIQDALGAGTNRESDNPADLSALSTASVGSGGPAWWPLLFGMLCLMATESILALRLSANRFGAN